jgi:hypothetical protein
MVEAAPFISFSADESTTVNNSSIIVVHCYIMSNWDRQPLLVALMKMEFNGTTSDSLTKLIVNVLSINYGLDETAIASKLLCFGVDGVAVFQDRYNGVTKQIIEQHIPFSVGMHCYGHRLQLCAKSLSQLDLLSSIEDLLLKSHAYFSHSPKKVTEFRTLAQLLDTKGLKLLKNVHMWWISCHSSMRRLLSEWKSVMAKMHSDKNDKKSGKKTMVSLILPLCSVSEVFSCMLKSCHANTLLGILCIGCPPLYGTTLRPAGDVGTIATA